MMVCADDYGISPEVNSAVLQLLQKQKINSVSVMVKRIDAASAFALKKYAGQTQIGLHIELFDSDLGFLQPTNSIKMQIDAFKNLFGMQPDYYDGHMHCHIYPFVRSALLKQLPPSSFVRSLSIPTSLRQPGSFVNSLYMRWLSLHNKALLELLAEKKLNTNGPIYGTFHAHTDIASVHRLFQSDTATDSLLFFHPGLKNENENLKRKDEYDFFSQI
jgi:predicted glycoside hydrolase/deacetylase ChbG (UPF0249 family)